MKPETVYIQYGDNKYLYITKEFFLSPQLFDIIEATPSEREKLLQKQSEIKQCA